MTFNLKKANKEQMSKMIKKKLFEDRVVQRLFERFEIQLERLKDLVIEIADLDGRYAETDAEKMVLDVNLFEGGSFFDDNYFVVVHEIVHWLSRIKEEEAYFNDPEEVLGFVAAIASELNSGQDLDIIWNKIYPKVEFHFNNESDARQFFQLSIQKAYDLLQ